MTVRELSCRTIVLADSGLLVHGPHRTTLRGTDRSIMRLLLDRHPHPVELREFALTLWPDGTPSDHARRTRVNRLRRQLTSVDLALRCQARLGFTLERSMTADPAMH